MSALMEQGTLPAEVARELIGNLERELLALPVESQVQFENVHNFTPGIYARSMFIPAGTINTSKIHKVEHFYTLRIGHLLVRDSHGALHELKGGDFGITLPGTKRAVYAVEDSLLTTFHPNPDNCHDIAELERRYVTDSYDEVPR